MVTIAKKRKYYICFDRNVEQTQEIYIYNVDDFDGCLWDYYIEVVLTKTKPGPVKLGTIEIKE